MLYNEEIELDEDFEGVDDSGAEVVTEFDEIDENTDYNNKYQYTDIDFPQDTPELIETPDPVVDPVVEDEDPIPDPEYETISETYEIIIQEYSQEYLQELEDSGYTFYVVYEDGTEDEVDISEIEEPTTSIEFLDDEAYVIANSILEHFWDDSAGVHVTQDSKEAWAQLVEDNFPDLDATHPHHNIIVNSYGVLIRSALKNLVQLSRSALAFYDGQGNNSSNIISTFGRGGIQIGPTDQKHLVINNNGITVYNGDGTVAPLTASNIQAIEANIQTLTAADVSITNRLTAAEGDIDTLETNTADIGTIRANSAKVTNLTAAQLEAANAYITALTSGSVTASDIIADTGKVHSLTANELSAATAYIAALTTGSVTAADIIADTGKIHSLTAEQLSAATAYIAALTAGSVTAADILADHAVVDDLDANYAHISNGVIDNAKIGHADVNGLSANYAHIANGIIDNATIDKANVNGLSATYATIANLNTANARITSLEGDHVTVSDFQAEQAKISALQADHVTVSDFQAEQANIDSLQTATADIATIRANSAKVANLTAQELEADHATVGALDTNYAQVNMANVNNAWIQNGTVKDGAITNAMINSVSANKLTAGTIDASNITVTNLNADNITAGTLNGQRIGAGTLSLDKLEEDVYTETEVDNIVDGLNDRIDGAIETFTGTVIPTLNNTPASAWTTNDIKDTHIGDVYYVVNSQSDQNGYCYRFSKINNAYSWQLIKDSDVTAALARLSDAEDSIGTIEQFDQEISSWKTNTDAEITSIKANHTSLATRVETAEGTLSNKVDTSTFNTLSQTVDGHSSSITQLTTETSTLTQAVDTLNTKTSSDSGNIVQFSDSIGFKEIIVHGKSIQNGTPTPDSPVEIESVDKISINITNKNLFGGEVLRNVLLANIPTATAGNDEYGDYVKFAAGSTSNNKLIFKFPTTDRYTIIFTTRNSASSSTTNILVKFTTGNIQYLDRSASTGAYEQTRWLTHASYQPDTLMTCWGAGTTYVYYNECGIFKGIVDITDYEPYQGQSIDIPLGDHQIRSLPNGTDDSFKLSYIGPSTEHEGWGVYSKTLVQRAEHVVLDGSGTEGYAGIFDGTYNRNVIVTRTGWISAGRPDAAKAVYSAMCNRLEAKNTAYTTWTTPGISGWPDNSAAFIFGFSKDVPFTTVAQFKEWLAENPLTIDYALATPVTHDLGVVELPLSEDLNLWASTFPSTAIDATWWHVAGRDEKNAIDISLTTLNLDDTLSSTLLPYPYKELTWVESDGHQMVQLDWIPNKNGQYGFELDFENYNTRNAVASAWTDSAEVNRTKCGFILGARNDHTLATGKQFTLGCYSPGYFFVGTSTNYDPKMYYDGRRQQCSYRNGVYTAPDGSTTTIPCGTVSPNWGMVIFALSNNATRSSYYLPSSTKLYSCKFYDGDTLAVDLVGAVRTSDNLTGLYDKVAKKFWACPGLGMGEVVGNLGERITILENSLRTNPTAIDITGKASRLWTAETPTIPYLEDGQQLTLRVRYDPISEAQSTELANLSDAASGSNIYLRLKLADGSYTKWQPCYYGAATRLDSKYYKAGSDVHFTYHENQIFGANAIASGWWADANYVDGNTNTVTDKHSTSVVAGKNGVKQYSLVMKDDNGNWTSLTTTHGTGTNKEAYTGALQYDMILYSSATSSAGYYSPGATTGDGTWYSQAVDIRYSTNVANNTTLGLTVRQPVYLVGTIANDGFFYLDTTKWWTQTEPTTEDGKTYIYLGYAYSAYQIWLSHDNPKYQFHDGKFSEIQFYTISKTRTKVNEVSDTVDEHTRKIGVLETTVENKADGSTVETVSNRLNTVSQTVDGHTQSISSMTSTIATKADSSTVSALQTQTNNISTTVSGHTSSIASINQTVATKADSSTVTELSTDYASFKEQVTGFESTVGTTYATKTEISDLSDELDSRTSTLGYSIQVFATSTDLTMTNPTTILTARVYKDGEEIADVDISNIGSLVWYRGDTQVGTGLTITVNQKARYIARLEVAEE